MTLLKKHYGILGLFILSLLLIADALWIPAKAQLAQWLMANAWQQSLQTGKPVTPWSWADTYPEYRLTIASKNIDQFVLAGDSGRNLAFGPVHIGISGDFQNQKTIMIAGHRDTHFSFLPNLQTGDRLDLRDRQKHAVQYTVLRTEIVHQRTLPEYLDQDKQLLLISCYPFDSIIPNTPWRYIVHAEPVGNKVHMM